MILIAIWAFIFLFIGTWACALGLTFMVIHDRIQKGSWFWERD